MNSYEEMSDVQISNQIAIGELTREVAIGERKNEVFKLIDEIKDDLLKIEVLQKETKELGGEL